MKCPNCGAVYDEPCRFCGFCGTPLKSEKKGTHRVPILILIALTILGIWVFFATGSDAPQMMDSQTPWFTLEGGALYFDPERYDGGSELTVPEALEDRPVTSLGDHCFADWDEVTVVTLPGTVESIGVSAFEDCGALRALDLPEGLSSIGTNAFAGCGELEAIHIPASVTYIGWDAFDGCDNLSFVFYDGTIDQWDALYTQELGRETTICCADGNYSHPN